MDYNWQWFIGGRIMFWVLIIAFMWLTLMFTLLYIIDPITFTHMAIQDVDITSIKEISEKYVASLDIEIDKPVIYRFVRFQDDDGFESEPGEEITLGTFHEWNGKYFIDISIDLYKDVMLPKTVIHETRHMIVEFLRDKGIINLVDYSESIAEEENDYYNNLFDSGVYLLKELNG